MPRLARPPELLHLIRFDSGTVHGWQVRMPPWFSIPDYSHFFSDKLYGGADAALAQARQLRDKLFLSADLEMRVKGHTTTSKNTSGLVGVTLAFAKGRTGEHAYCWKAVWSEEGGQKRKNFSVAKYGFEKALALAVKMREEKTNLRFSQAHLQQALSLKGEVSKYIKNGSRTRRKVLPAPQRTSPKKSSSTFSLETPERPVL